MQRPIRLDKRYRRPLEEKDLSRTPFRHAFERLQREQIRSPDHSLGNVALHLRHWRTLGISQGG
jgi:hypothetical protein